MKAFFLTKTEALWIAGAIGVPFLILGFLLCFLVMAKRSEKRIREALAEKRMRDRMIGQAQSPLPHFVQNDPRMGRGYPGSKLGNGR